MSYRPKAQHNAAKNDDETAARPFFSIVGTVLSLIPLYSLSRFESYSEPLT